MLVSMRCNSPTTASSRRRPRYCEGYHGIAAAGPVAAASAPCRVAANGVLDDPLLYPLCLSDEPMADRRRRSAAPVAHQRAGIHRRLLAWADDADPDGLAANGADAHVDLGASRRAIDRWRDDLFRHRFDRRLDPPRRLFGVAG